MGGEFKIGLSGDEFQIQFLAEDAFFCDRLWTLYKEKRRVNNEPAIKKTEAETLKSQIARRYLHDQYGYYFSIYQVALVDVQDKLLVIRRTDFAYMFLTKENLYALYRGKLLNIRLTKPSDKQDIQRFSKYLGGV